MKEIIVITRGELEEIIDNCFARHISKILEPAKKQEPKLLYSLHELANFLGCSTVTAQSLKSSGKIRYRQHGRKLIFNTSEVLEDLDQKRWKNKNQ